MSIAIRANNLVKKFGDLAAVNDITFQVSPGETFGILGENGAGKSTTMRMIACRSPLTSGSLTVGGLDVKTDERLIRAKIGIVPQENNLDPDLKVLENLLVYSRYFRIPREKAEARSRELLDFIRVTEKAQAKIDALSGGMKRRLIIARALLHRPKILLLDEPTTGLDPGVRQEIWEKLEELRRDEGLTIVLSTHYMEEAEKLCHRLIMMSHGKIVAEGVPKELIRERGKSYALEVREAGELPLQVSEAGISANLRGNTHVYFADTAEQLTPLMPAYGNRPMLLRPSNLEDVFLQITDSETAGRA
jgi:lipooligosaccharide transport system ATP-binding protein